MQKRGKEVMLELSDDYKVVCGTVDNKNAKAVYINLSAWGKPTDDNENIDYSRVVSRLSKYIKQSIYNYLDKELSDVIYPERTIVDLDIRESGIKFGKSSFMNCDITIYQKEDGTVINEGRTPNILSSVAKVAIECLDDYEYFKFKKKKY